MPALSGAEGTPDPRPKRGAPYGNLNALKPVLDVLGGSRRKRGAPKGNLNALKTGASSRQLKLLIEKMQSDPELQRLMLAFAPRRQTHDRSLQPAINVYAAMTRRARERAKRELARRYDWLPYFDEGEAPF